MTEELTQICTRCRRELDLEHFARRTASARGRQRQCRECSAESLRSWRRQKADDEFAEAVAELEVALDAGEGVDAAARRVLVGVRKIVSSPWSRAAVQLADAVVRGAPTAQLRGQLHVRAAGRLLRGAR